MASQTYTQGTPIVWADTTDFSSPTFGLTRTDQIDLTSVATVKARQGARADLTANRAPYYHVNVGLEYAVAPTATAQSQLYFACTPNTTLLPAGLTASDADYKSGEELEWLRLVAIFVPLNLTADATATVQHIDAGWIIPTDRYIIPVFYNGSLQALHSSAANMYIALTPQGINVA